MERPVVEKDPREVGEPHLGLKVLYNPLNAGASIDCDIIAVHGIGAHPDLTWCKKVEQGSNKEGADVNWLEDANMLPAALPNARIMRFGAKTKWFGNRSIQQTASDVARHLLGAIRRDRDTNENDSKTRPLIFVAHCFGGLVVMKALNEAVDSDLNRHIFNSVTGIAFMGTPFRGAEQTGQTALVLGAREVYRDVHPGILEITAPHSEMRRNILREFTRKQKDLDAYIVCFYELEYCDVMVVLGEEKDPEMPETIRVDENSGSLDSADEKIGLQRHHYNMNKFGGPGEETYKIVQEQVVNMATRSKTKARYGWSVQFIVRGHPSHSDL
ncbi:hypothetical protein F5Y16DRAFT_297205 [Xylariaceae sp. FL0255]|nr:hypothetical protein F5Y16DRAFT_297205 [Xylariaceae sp. FL0255]